MIAKSVVKIFRYKLYLEELLVLFLCYFLTEPIFAWLFVPKSTIAGGYVKVLSLLIYPFVLLKFRDLKTFEKVYIGLFTLLMIKLVFESMFEYGKIFAYLEIYIVIFPVVFVVFIKSLLRKLDINLLEFVAKFYLLTYVVFMLVYGHGFSLRLSDIIMDDYGPFSGDTRIIHAQSIFMMVLPYLWYLNKFVQTRKTKYFVWFLFCFFIILVHQHRSVWTSTIVATAFYFINIIRTNQKAISGTLKFFIISICLLAISLIFISSLYPEIISYFSTRFSEILHPVAQEGTASFRFDQSRTYLRYVEVKPLFGWTFEGFEMDNPMVDWWPEKSGQHFHEGYIEMLFYHGIVGLLLKYSFLVYILIISFRKRLPNEAVILAAFCISGFMFSLSYVLPLIFWAHAGMCLYYFDDKKLPRPSKYEEDQFRFNKPLTIV